MFVKPSAMKIHFSVVYLYLVVYLFALWTIFFTQTFMHVEIEAIRLSNKFRKKI